MRRMLMVCVVAMLTIALPACVTTGTSTAADDPALVKTKLAQVCAQASAIDDVLTASVGIVDQDVLDQIATIRPYVTAVCSDNAGLTDLQSFAKGGVDGLLNLVPLLPIAQEKKQQALLAIALVKIIVAPLNTQ